MFKIEFLTENAAFDGENKSLEIARILREIADDFENGRNPDGSTGKVRDENGNPVGTWSVKS